MSAIAALRRHRPATALGATLGAAGLLATALTVAAGPTTAHAAAAATTGTTAALRTISCSTATSSKDFYDGPSASAKYDARFSNSASIPNLGTHTPQGAGTWWNWDGSKDLLLVASYQNGANSLITGIDPNTNKTVGVVAIAGSHAGGITTSNGWAFVQGKDSGGSGTIRKYRLSTLKAAMKKAGTPYIKQVGTARKVYAASFLTSYGGYLWSGKFNPTGRGKMYQYKINSNGSLTTINRAWEIPTKTQGLLVTANHFIYSTSFKRDKRSNLYVVRRGQPDLDKAKLTCFRAPSMAEGITEYGGRVYLVFESGSYLYRSDPKTLNVITKLHTAPLSTLTSLV